MRFTIYLFLFAVTIIDQQCLGLNFIDLPGFGSDEKPEDELVNSGRVSRISSIKANSRLSPDDSDSDKLEQNREQTLESRKLNKQQEERFSTYTPKTQSVERSSESSLNTSTQTEQISKQYPPVRSSTTPNFRRKWFVSEAREKQDFADYPLDDDKDENIKSKISMLVQQTMHDTEARISTVQKLKERHRHEAAYRVGFILSMIKKSRDVLNELFNVAVKHRDEWKALEQLKIFELIVHTNVDTTNLVRQLVEMHIQNLNNTAHSDHTESHPPDNSQPQQQSYRAKSLRGGAPPSFELLTGLKSSSELPSLKQTHKRPKYMPPTEKITSML